MNNSDQKLVEIKEKKQSFLEINQQAFTELLTFVDFVDEKLNIGFVEVNFAQDRDILIEALIKHQDCQNIQFEVLNFSDPNLRFLRDELVEELKRIKVAPDKKLILLITGLEKSIGVVEDYPAVLTNLNFVRDDLRHTVCYPLLLFLPDYSLTRLAKYAPDFWAWGRKVFDFKTVHSTLVKSVKNQIFYNRNIDSLELSEKKDRIDLLLRLLSEYRSPDNQENKLNLPNIINIYNQLGIACRSIGKYQEAIDYCQKALKMAQDIGDLHGKAQSLSNLGIIKNLLGKYQEAINYYRNSLDISRQIGDRHGEAESLNNLGIAYNSLGKYQQAINYYQQSLEMLEKIGDRRIEANSLGNLGGAYYYLGEYQQAINYYQKSLEIAHQIGNRHGEANSWFNLGLTYDKLEQKMEAQVTFKNARKLYQAIGLEKKVEDCNKAIQDLEIG